MSAASLRSRSAVSVYTFKLTSRECPNWSATSFGSTFFYLMIDGTEGQAVLCFSIKQGLELVTVDTADFPPGVFQKQMVSDSVFIILGC